MDEPKSTSPLLFTPQIPSKRKGHNGKSEKKLSSILRTPSIPEYSESGDIAGSSSKKRVRLSIDAKKIFEERRLYSPFERFSQMTPRRILQRFSSQKKKFQIKRLSLDALLDPDVQPIWSSEMATPPKSDTENLPLKESPKKGVARSLFKETSLQQEFNDTNTNISSVISINNTTDSDISEMPTSPAVTRTFQSILSCDPSPSFIRNEIIDPSLSPCLRTGKTTSIDEVISKDSLLDHSSFIDITLSPSVASLNMREDKRKTLEHTNSSGFASMENTRTVDHHEDKPSIVQEPDDLFLSPPIIASNKKKHVTWSASTDMKILSQSTPIVFAHTDSHVTPLADSFEDSQKINSIVTQKPLKEPIRKLDFPNDVSEKIEDLKKKLKSTQVDEELSCAVVPNHENKELISDSRSGAGLRNLHGFDLSPPISTKSIKMHELPHTICLKESLKHCKRIPEQPSSTCADNSFILLHCKRSSPVSSFHVPEKPGELILTVPDSNKLPQHFASPDDTDCELLPRDISKCSLFSESTDSLFNVSGTLLQKPQAENYKDTTSSVTSEDTQVNVNSHTNNGEDSSCDVRCMCSSKKVIDCFHKSTKRYICTKSKQFLYPLVRGKKEIVENLEGSLDKSTRLQKHYSFQNIQQLKKPQEKLQHMDLKASKSNDSFDKCKEQVFINMDELTQIYSQDLRETTEMYVENPNVSKRMEKNLDKNENMKTDKSSSGSQISLGKEKKNIAVTSNKSDYEFQSFLFDDNIPVTSNRSGNEFQGFQTGLGKKVQISEESLKAAKKLFAEEDMPVTSKRSGNEFQGFQTGLGKKVEISEDSLKVAKKLFAEDDMSVTSNRSGNEFQGFQTGLGKKVQISEDSLKAAKKLFAEEDMPVISKRSGNKFQGFQTGLGKKVQISGESLKAAKKLFAEDDMIATSNKSAYEFQGFQTGLGKKVEISEDSLKAAKKLFAEEDMPVTSKRSGNEFHGFQTGLGRKVQISEDSLKAAKKLFAEEDMPFTSKRSGNEFHGFQTGLGKKVEISEDSLKAAKKLFAEEDMPVTSKRSGNEFHGFQTGLGKKVEISEDSLKAAKKLFAEEDMPVTSKRSGNEFHGFQTGLGRKVQISEDSLKAAKKLFAEEDMPFTSKRSGNEFHGFQTGLGKKVEISEDSLKAAKKLFVEEDMPVASNRSGNEFQGFQNSNRYGKEFQDCNVCFGKQTKSSKESLTATKRSPIINSSSSRVTKEESHSDIAFVKGESSGTQSAHQYLKTAGSRKKVSYTSPAAYHFDRDTSLNVPLRPVYSTPDLCDGIEQRKLPQEGKEHKSLFVTPFKLIAKGNENKQDITPNVSKDKRYSFYPLGRKRLKLSNSQQKSTSSEGIQLFHKDGRLYGKKKITRKSLAEFVNYVPPQNLSWKELNAYGIEDAVLRINSDNALAFVFNADKYFSKAALDNKYAIVGDEIKLEFDENLQIGIEQFKKALMTSKHVNKKLIEERWVENHYRWIVWKLASYERRYPEQFSARCLTPSSLMYQLKYRYDKEIEHAERSCLKCIYEHDDVASSRIVLCVSKVDLSADCKTESESNIESNSNVSKKFIELTDGWYSIKASLDEPLSEFLSCGKIRVGTKLMIYGAILAGTKQACSPLEAPGNVFLQLSANSTRRASWETKLGYQFPKVGFCVPLKSLYSKGGMVGCVSVVILRKYPLQWMEKKDGRCVFRSTAAEQQVQNKHEKEKQKKMEALYLKLQVQFDNQTSKHVKMSRNCKKPVKAIKSMCDGKEIYELIERSGDPSIIEALLSDSQKEMASHYKRKLQDTQQAELAESFQSAWKAMSDEFPDRVSIPLQRYRVTDVHSDDERKDAMLTVWKPSADISETWKEGSALTIYNLNVSQSRYKQVSSQIQMATTSLTKYHFLEDNSPGDVFTPRHVHSIESLYAITSLPYNELDVVGLVISVVQKKRDEQTVFICDHTMRFLAVKIFSGLQAQGCEESVKENVLVAFTSLTWPKFIAPNKHEILQTVFTDISSVTGNPKERYLKDALQACERGIVCKQSFFSNMKKRLEENLEHRDKPVQQSSKVTSTKVNVTPDQGRTCLEKSIENYSENLPSEKLQSRHKLQIKKRLSLERYREPPKLSSLPNTDENVIKAKFRSPSTMQCVMKR